MLLAKCLPGDFSSGSEVADRAVKRLDGISRADKETEIYDSSLLQRSLGSKTLKRKRILFKEASTPTVS